MYTKAIAATTTRQPIESSEPAQNIASKAVELLKETEYEMYSK